MPDATPPPRLAPGGLVLGVLGLAAFLTSLFVPWFSTVMFAGPDTTAAPTGVLAFGVGSGLYLVGVVLVAMLAAATLATRGTVRDVLGMTGLASTSIGVAALIVIAVRISDASERVLAKAAEIDRESSPDIFVSLHAGPILGGVAVLLLAVAVTRFTWPAHSAACYAAAGTAACFLALGIPWGSRDAIFADRVEVQDYWFPHFGVLGAVGASAAVVALSASAATFAFGRRAWWPPIVALAGAGGVMVATGFIGTDHLVADPRLADATFTDPAVNSGIPSLCGFVALVLLCCALVSAIRQYRRARRQAQVTPVYLPPPDQQWW